MKYRCNYTRLEPIGEVVPNPRNPNTHPEEQVALLAKIIAYQGWRLPIVISKRSGFVVRGHGRLLAAQCRGLKKVPVEVQAYDSDEQERADLIADNRLAELAEMDRGTLKDVLAELDTGELDLDVTGWAEDARACWLSEIHADDDEGGDTGGESVCQHCGGAL